MINVLISTVQQPHYFDYFEVPKYYNAKARYFDCCSESPFRTEFPDKENLRVSLSKFLRNKILGQIRLKYNRKIIKVKPPENRWKLNDSERLVIDKCYKSYMVNKFRVSSVNFGGKRYRDIERLYFFAESIVCKLINENVKHEDQFLLFNGRLPLEYFLRHFLEKNNLNNILYMETSQFPEANNCIVREQPIHDLASYKSEILNFQSKHNESFIIAESKRLSRRWEKKFSNQQGVIPTEYSSLEFVFFLGSLDEYQFYYEDPIDQLSIMHELIAIAKQKSINLFFRVHPNTWEKSIETQMFWRLIKFIYPNNIICFSEETSSYALIQTAKVTFSVGSSLAPQALLMNKMHILIGNQSFYAELDSFYSLSSPELLNLFRANTREQLVDYFQQIPLPTERDNVIIASSHIFERYDGIPRTEFNKKIKNMRLSHEFKFKRDIQVDDEKLKVCLNNIQLLCRIYANLADILNNVFVGDRLYIGSDYTWSKKKLNLETVEVVRLLDKPSQIDRPISIEDFDSIPNFLFKQFQIKKYSVIAFMISQDKRRTLQGYTLCDLIKTYNEA